jgi:capsular polysaccharide transport system permease protein
MKEPNRLQPSTGPNVQIVEGRPTGEEITAKDWSKVVSQLPKPTPARRSRIVLGWFLLCVIAPFVATWFYISGVATQQYSASFSYVMQGSGGSAGTANGDGTINTSPTSAGASMAEMMVANFMVSDYLSSPQAIKDIEQKLDVRAMFSQSRIDRLARLPEDASQETLARYWQGQISTNFDMMTGLTTVTIRAFSPEDAQALAAEMVVLSENLINELNLRPLADSVTFLEGQVASSITRLKAARDAVQAFRSKYLSIDPAADASMTDILVGKLTDQYVAVTTQIAVLSSQLTEDAPSVTQLERQAAAIADEIVKARQRVAQSSAELSNISSPASYAAQLQEFQNLQLELTIATSNYQSSEAALNAAKQRLSQQHFYVLTYVQPSAPQTSNYPDLFRALVIVLAVSLCFWIVSTLVALSLRDHL